MESYDALRKEARRLESVIDSKLVDYSKLVANANTSSASTRASSFDNLRGGDGTQTKPAPPLASSSTPALRVRPAPTLTPLDSRHIAALQRRPTGSSRELNLSNTLSAAEASTAELEALLARLSSVIESLSNVDSASAPTASHAHRAHTVQRHSEILHDYNKEFRKTRKSVGSMRDSVELMSGATVPRQSPPQGSVSASDSLNSERVALAGANAAAESAMGAGMSLKEDLERQRAMFASMVERMETMSEGIPAVNRLIQNVRRKKKRDVLILAAVIATLLGITFSWKLSR